MNPTIFEMKNMVEHMMQVNHALFLVKLFAVALTNFWSYSGAAGAIVDRLAWPFAKNEYFYVCLH